MPKNDKEDLQKHTLNLYPGDYDRLRLLFPDIGAGAVIRRLVRKFLDQTEGQAVEVDNLEIKL